MTDNVRVGIKKEDIKAETPIFNPLLTECQYNVDGNRQNDVVRSEQMFKLLHTQFIALKKKARFL
jgi:hypothetical protein